MYIRARLSSFHSPYSCLSKRNVISVSGKYKFHCLREGTQRDVEFVLKFLNFDTVCPNIEF